MARFFDITGLVFNRLTVIKKVAAKSKSSAYWECKCECGARSIVAGCKLKDGSTKSCGCHRSQLFNNKTHGMANKTPTYRTWKEMRQRCLNPKSDKAKWYREKGVTICSRWDSFENFLADMGERPKGLTLDRKNPHGNYEPSNCRWATQKEQMNNTRVIYDKRVKGVTK